jgi:hypothetical protein
MLAILAEKLEKRFPPDICAVDGVDLSIEEGAASSAIQRLCGLDGQRRLMATGVSPRHYSASHAPAH